MKNCFANFHVHWLVFQNVNMLEILLSLLILLSSQNIIKVTLIFIGRLCRNGFRKDIEVACLENQLSVNELVFKKNDVNTIQSKSMSIFRIIITNLYNNQSEFLQSSEIAFSIRGLYIINKLVIMFITLLYLLSIYFLTISHFIIISSIIFSILICINAFIMMAIEYKNLVFEIYGINHLKKEIDEPNPPA